MKIETIESVSVNTTIHKYVDDGKVKGYIRYSPKHGEYCFYPSFETTYTAEELKYISEKLTEFQK